MWLRFLRTFGTAAALSLASMSAASAQSPTNKAPAKHFKNMCLLVGEQTRVRNGVEYLYRERILNAANALGDRDREVIRQKVSKVWDWNDPHLYCTNIQFDVSRGNILKYAVASAFDHFLEDMIAWGVDLNRIDNPHHVGTFGGGTVLDYVALHIKVQEGTAMARRLEYYYRILRDGGALHMRELPAAARQAAGSR